MIPGVFIRAEVDVCYMNGINFIGRKFDYYEDTSRAMRIFDRVVEKYKSGGALVSLRVHYNYGIVTLKTYWGDYQELSKILTKTNKKRNFK